MAEDFKISVSAELSKSSLTSIESKIRNLGNKSSATLKINTHEALKKVQSIETKINSLKNKPIHIQIADAQARNSLNVLERQMQRIANQARNLGTIRINLGGNGGGSGGNLTHQVNEVTTAYNDLMRMAGKISSLRLQIAGLDSKDFYQLSELSSQLQRVQTDYNNLFNTFNRNLSTNQLDVLSRTFENTTNQISVMNAKMSDTTAVKNVEQSYQQLLSMIKEISSLEIDIAKIDPKNVNELTTLTTRLDELKKKYIDLFNSSSGNLSDAQISNLMGTVQQMYDKLSLLDNKYADTKAKFAEEIKVKIDTKAIDSSLSSMESNLQKIKSPANEVSVSVNDVRVSYVALQNAMKSGSVDDVINAYRRYESALEKANNQINININSQRKLEQSQRQVADAQKLALNKQNFSLGMDTWLKQNSAAASEFGSRIRILQSELKSCDSVRFNGIKTEFQMIKKEAELAGKTAMTFGDRLKTQLSRFSAYISVATIFGKVSQGLRSAYNEVLKVDTAMTELRRVTDLTENQYANMYDQMADSAQRYGAELDKIIHSTASWVKLGFDDSQSVRLAEITSMYQHVTDLDEDTAVKNLVTAYKGFQDQLLEMNNGDATKAMEQVADIYDLLGNRFAESAADVGEGLRHSASVLAQGGASIQEAAGMFTGIQEVLQNASTAGNTLKILTLRIRGMKGELEEMGEEVDGNITSISKIQTQILNLTHGAVNIFDENNNFRDIYNIMQDISKVYDELSDPERASLLEIIAGRFYQYVQKCA